MTEFTSLAALSIALIVPWLGFRLALRSEARKHGREQQTAVYVEMLAEAWAEKEWFLARLHNQVHGTDISWIEDLRLPAQARRCSARAVPLRQQRGEHQVQQDPAGPVSGTATRRRRRN